MKVLVVGAGLSGASIARLMHDSHHHVTVIEKADVIGGLCITKESSAGIKYEPYGSRIFHSSNPEVIEFAKRFSSFNSYIHRKGVLISGVLLPFPLRLEHIPMLPQEKEIFREIEQLPELRDNANFETSCLSVFGPTLYGLFIKNYTERMWGCAATEISSEWAPKRLELRTDSNDWVFRDQWQGLPSDGYSLWIQKMLDGIPLELGTTTFNRGEYDLVFSSAPLDQILNYKYDSLTYRSMNYYYRENERWENESFGTINLPQHDKYVRKCNFKILHQQKHLSESLIQYQEPCAHTEKNTPMYPLHSDVANEVYERCLQEVCRTNIVPIGRLGLYKYLDMDKAIESSMRVFDMMSDYLSAEPSQRVLMVQGVRSQF